MATQLTGLGRPRSMRMLVAVAVATLAAAALAAAAAAPRAAAAVEWDSSVVTAPTHLPPGGEGVVRIVVANAGSTHARPWPTVSFELPAGVTVGAPPPDKGWSCSGAPTVTCVQTTPFYNLLGVAPYSYTALPGGGVYAPVNLVVDIAPDAPQGTFPFEVTVAGGGGSAAVEEHTLKIASEQLPFGAVPGSFRAGAFDENGEPFTQAGGHPYDATASFELSTRFEKPVGGGVFSDAIQGREALKDVVVDLPPGFVGDPSAVPKCESLKLLDEARCPASSQVGVTAISPPVGSGGTLRMAGVYNMAPPKDAPAQFAFRSPIGTVLLTPFLRSDRDWGISVTVKNITEADVVYSATTTLWGVPADPSHDDQRCAYPNFIAQACVGTNETGLGPSSGAPPDIHDPHPSSAGLKPFLTNPTECTGAPEITTLHLSSWGESPGPYGPDGDPAVGHPNWVTAQDEAPAITGCERLQFNPTVEVTPTSTEPDSPTGLEFRLSVPQNDDPDGLATAHLKDTTVVLPEGMTVNPSSAQGLGACSSAQMGLLSKSPVRFDKLEPSCPASSKIGTVEVDTPLLEEPLTGDVHLARQGDNPFDSLLAIYIVVRGPGLMIKLAGHVTADAQTGRLTTTVLENPQVPFNTLTVRLKDGPRAPLTTPATCGTKVATTTLTSWAGHSRQAADTFEIDCPGNAAGFDPGFSAGSTNPVAGVFSPFTMRVTRDGGEALGRVNVTMPRGMLASLRHVGVCSEAQLASAAGKSGRQTQGSPACPLTSQVGTVTVGAGAGPAPFYPTLPGTDVSGRVFLTEAHTDTQYNQPGVPQAAYGLAIEVPAVAGPFDLGTVLVRAAIYVDPTTAEISVLSDRMPRILQGIPLNVRDVRVSIDRANFTYNPTSCEERKLGGDIRAQDNTAALRPVHFDIGNCERLRFKPRLAMRLKGRRQTKTGGHPAVRARVRQSGIGESGIRRARVVLPRSLALDPDNAQALCEFEDGTKRDLENHCPEGSIVGRARAVSPLLKQPLVGNVYFVKNIRIDPDTGNEIRTLPMIVAALRGEVAINLRGESSVDRRNRLVNTFADVPDAPISRFNLNIKGGRNGILAVTATEQGNINICKSRQIARTAWKGHNGDYNRYKVRMRTPCGKANKRANANRRKANAKRRAAKRRAAKRRRNGV